MNNLCVTDFICIQVGVSQQEICLSAQGGQVVPQKVCRSHISLWDTGVQDTSRNLQGVKRVMAWDVHIEWGHGVRGLGMFLSAGD
jgi:hypothetical protein